MNLFPFLLLAVLTERCSASVKVVDLTHVHDGQSMTWANNPPFNSTILWRGYYFKDIWMELNYFCTPEHMGTHFDAPSHFSKTGWRMHQVPIEKMMGPGVVIDVKAQAAKDRDYRVTLDDVLQWEKKYGSIPENAVVLMNSGWDKYYRTLSVNEVFGTDMYNDTTSYHFPGWHENTVQWIITNRKINILGVDTPSTDYGQGLHYPVHVLVLAHEISQLESVANLDDIPASGSTIYAPAMKLYEGSGAPVRVFATVDMDIWNNFVKDSNSATTLQMSFVLFVNLLLTLTYDQYFSTKTFML